MKPETQTERVRLPLESLATRKFDMSAPKNYRGSLYDDLQNRELVFESGLERDFITLAVASGKFETLIEQPRRVHYVDDDGVERSHVFDLYGVTWNGLRVYIDVKPKRRVESSGVLVVQRLIREQHGSALADRFLVRTEDHIHEDDLYDARMIIRARRMPCVEADKVVRGMLATVSGWVRVAALVAASGLRASAFNAIARLVGSGALEVRDGSRIAYGAEVRRTAR